MTALIVILLLLCAATGTGVVLSRSPVRQVLALAVNGLVLALLFMALQAPDVAFSEIAVGTVMTPLLFLAVLASTRMIRRTGESDRK
jgi:energy-converting hydrogenase B subunit D